MRILSLGLAAVAPAILIVAFLVGSTPDEEEFRWGILSTTLHIQALAQGRLAAWEPALGLGMPAPMVPNFNTYPLAPLLIGVTAATWAQLLYVFQTIVGALGIWQLGAMLRLTAIVRAVCVFTFLLATPTLNYAVTDFWPSHYVMWTTAPWLLWMAWRLLNATGAQLRSSSVLLGVTAGIVLATTHPGHVPVYGVIVLAVGIASWRAVGSRWAWLLLAAAIAVAIASPSLLQLVRERTIFDPALGIVKLPEPLPPDALRDVFLRPLSFSERAWEVEVVARGTRLLFFGGPFAVLALVGAIRCVRTRPDLVIAAVVGTVLLFTSLLPLTFVSRFHFRDPLTLCAILLAGLGANSLLDGRRVRIAATLLLILQVGVVAAAASPFVESLWYRDARNALWFKGATAQSDFPDRLLALMSQPGRIAYSPRVDYAISQGERLHEGLGVNALAYRGRALVNGSFKGVSNDVLWPDDRLFYGRIRLPRQAIESDAVLDLLGIRYILADPEEAVAPGLRAVGPMPATIGQPLVLYENSDASQGGIIVDASPAALLPMPTYPECAHDRLLCRDLTPLAQVRRRDRVEVARRGGRIDVGVDRADQPRLLVLAEMFRPDWRAIADGEALRTHSVGSGLLGVTIPPGATTVRAEYRPTSLFAATVLSWTVLAAGCLALARWWKLSRRASAQRSG